MATPTLADTNAAKPEWFKRFSTESIDFGSEAAWQTQPDRRDIKFNLLNGGRWQIGFDIKSRTDDSPLPREEVSAGAKFQITPRFSFGGQVSVGANELDDSRKWEDQQIEAGVRLQSAFKF